MSSRANRKQPSLENQEDSIERDKGGRILAGKKWRTFNFIVEVALESPGSVDEEEAAEDAAEFIATIGRTAGRVHESYASITRADEYGPKRPKDAPVFIREYPTGKKVELKLPRGLAKKEAYAKLMKAKPTKVKPKKKIKKKKKVGRY